MNYFFLLIASAIPVVKICLLSLVGVALAHLGVLDSRGRQALSRVSFYVFIPALTFSKLAAAVDLTNMGNWWFLPFNVLLSIGIGMVIGWAGARLLNTPKRLHPHIICSIATGNVGNVPMVLVAALCQDPSSPIANAVAGGKCAELGIAYVVFAMWVAGLFQFSVAYMLLRRPPEDTEGRLPEVVQDGGPGHLRLHNAWRGSTADIDVLELQPLRSADASCSAQEGRRAPHGEEDSGSSDVQDATDRQHMLSVKDPEEGGEGDGWRISAERGASAVGAHRVPGSRFAGGRARLDDLPGQPQYDQLDRLSESSASSGGPPSEMEGGARDSQRQHRHRAALAATTRDSSSSLLAEEEAGVWKGGRRTAGAACRHDGDQEDSCGPGATLSHLQKDSKCHDVEATDGLAAAHSVPASPRVEGEGQGGRAWRPGQGTAAYAALRATGSCKAGTGIEHEFLKNGGGMRGRFSQLAALPWVQMFNLPVLSAFAGLFVGCVPPLKGLLIGSGAPLGFVRDCLEVLGEPMIPCMMMVLGAVLYKGPGGANVPPRLIVGVAAVRLLLIPCLGTLALLGLRWAGALRPPDSLFMLVLLLGHATPTAVNVQTLATLHQNGEAEVSCLLFWQYMGFIITMPLLLSLFFHVI